MVYGEQMCERLPPPQSLAEYCTLHMYICRKHEAPNMTLKAHFDEALRALEAISVRQAQQLVWNHELLSQFCVQRRIELTTHACYCLPKKAYTFAYFA